MKTDNQFCLFYRITIKVEYTWFVVGIFRNEDHLAFERTDEENNAILDFFVPAAGEQEFLSIIYDLHAKGYVLGYQKGNNPFDIKPQP